MASLTQTLVHAVFSSHRHFGPGVWLQFFLFSSFFGRNFIWKVFWWSLRLFHRRLLLWNLIEVINDLWGVLVLDWEHALSMAAGLSQYIVVYLIWSVQAHLRLRILSLIFLKKITTFKIVILFFKKDRQSLYFLINVLFFLWNYFATLFQNF